MSTRTVLAAAFAALALTALPAIAQDYEPKIYELSSPKDVQPSAELRALIEKDVLDAGVLRIGGRWDAPPYAFYPEGTQDWTGFEADLVRGIAAVLGLEPQVNGVTNEQTLIGVTSNLYDVGVGFYADLEAREEQVTFVDYLKNIFGIVVAGGNPHNVQKASDACGLRTIDTNGQFDYAAALNRVCDKEGLTPASRVQLADGVIGLLALKSGQIDVYFQSYGQQKYYEDVVKEPIHATPAPEIGWVSMGLIVNKQKTGLQQAILGAVKELHRIGYYDELIKKWGFEPLYEANPTINGGSASAWWPKAATK